MWGGTLVARWSSQNGELQVEQGMLSLNIKQRMFEEDILMLASGLHCVCTSECFVGIGLCVYIYTHIHMYTKRQRHREIML